LPASEVAAVMETPLCMVFIDGGHSWKRTGAIIIWSRGTSCAVGILVIHETLFVSRESGGQAPMPFYRLAAGIRLFRH